MFYIKRLSFLNDNSYPYYCYFIGNLSLMQSKGLNFIIQQIRSTHTSLLHLKTNFCHSTASSTLGGSVAKRVKGIGVVFMTIEIA